LQGRDGLRSDPFAAAGKTQSLGRCRLHTNPHGRNRKDFGDAFADRGAVRADLGRFGNDRQVDMADPPAARRDALAGERQEAVRCRAAPLRIARRKMVANIAFAKRAEQRIGQRMKRDVGINVAFKSMTMRDCQSADSQRLVGDQPVHIIAHAHRRLHHDMASQ